MRDAVVLARVKARARGAERLLAEADSAGVTVRGLERFAHAALSKDWQRGTLLGRSYANRWSAKATELDSAKAATQATTGSLERIAISESSEAYSAGRSMAALGARVDVDRDAIGAATQEARSSTQLLKVWDASLDRRTCSICASADGTIVDIDGSFPAGEPGAVHAYCRCGWSMLTMSEARGVLNIKTV